MNYFVKDGPNDVEFCEPHDEVRENCHKCLTARVAQLEVSYEDARSEWGKAEDRALALEKERNIWFTRATVHQEANGFLEKERNEARAELTTLRASHAALMGAVKDYLEAFDSVQKQQGPFERTASVIVADVRLKELRALLSQAPAEDAPKPYKSCGPWCVSSIRVDNHTDCPPKAEPEAAPCLRCQHGLKGCECPLPAPVPPIVEGEKPCGCLSGECCSECEVRL